MPVLETGMISLKIDGKRLRNTQHASYLADRKASGDSLIFTVSRNGQVFDATIRVKKIIEFGNLSFLFAGINLVSSWFCCTFIQTIWFYPNIVL